MFSKPVLLDLAKHRNTKLNFIHNYHFAAQEIVMPIVFSEMADIAREYPLIFLKKIPTPFALLGFQKSMNAYVDVQSGRWMAEYLPGRVRAYPFSLHENPAKPGEFGIVVDSQSSLLSTNDGQPLFADGKPTQILSDRIKLLEQMQKAQATTVNMVETIRIADLLKDQAIKIKMKGTEDSQLTGIQIVDEKKLNSMSHEDFAKLRDKGALPLIYAHLLSLANLRRGPLKGYTPVQTADSLGFIIGDDDMISFQ
ncbi:SapC family protein [Desulfonatronum parangueonense]